MYEAVKKKDNEKLTSLKTQMVEMGNDYEDMIRAREEARKQLEAKFEDVYRKLQANKDFTIAEGKRVNDTLKAFQLKFEAQLKSTEEKLRSEMQTEKNYMREQLSLINGRIEKLDKGLEEEKEERLRQTDETLKPIRQDISSLKESYETERATRLEREKEILQKLADEVYKLMQLLEKERSERVFKLGEMKDQFWDEMKAQTKFVEDFQKRSADEFNTMKADLEAEMESRFAHQDEILDNLSNFIKTFQDTLKVVGKSA